jgi:hypothetical protein
LLTNGAAVESEVGDPEPEDNEDVVETEVIEVDHATFLVSKDFSDDSPAQVEVRIQCNTGIPLMQSRLISEDDPVNFVVTEFEVGTMDCEVSELTPAGYTPSYSSSGDSDNSSDDDGCYFTSVGSDHANACAITNELEPVDVVVNKEWVEEHPDFELPTWVLVTLSCNSPIFGVEALEGNGTYTSSVYIQPGSPGEFQVFPEWDGSTFCSASEEPEAGVLQDTSDCELIPLAPGEGGECTIVNTRLFAGIPTLSRNGLILMTLLMLGMGALAYRRLN